MLLRQSKSAEPTLKDFVAFMEEETTLVNDPLYSRHTVNKDYSSKQPDRGQSRNNFRSSFKAAATKQDQTPRIKICPFCDQQHDIEECPVILAKDINQRSIMIRSKKLCFGCLGKMTPDHNSRTCTRRRTCKVCRRKHATILHGFKFRPNSANHNRSSGFTDGDKADHRDQGGTDNIEQMGADQQSSEMYTEDQ